jgi:hypothetical protein
VFINDDVGVGSPLTLFTSSGTDFSIAAGTQIIANDANATSEFIISIQHTGDVNLASSGLLWAQGEDAVAIGDASASPPPADIITTGVTGLADATILQGFGVLVAGDFAGGPGAPPTNPVTPADATNRLGIWVPNQGNVQVNLVGSSPTVGKFLLTLDGITLVSPVTVPEGNINRPGGTVWINDRNYGPATVALESLLALLLAAEKLDELLAAAAQAEFFMKPPLWIEIQMEEEEEDCSQYPKDSQEYKDCIERQRRREGASLMQPGLLPSVAFGRAVPTLLHDAENEEPGGVRLSWVVN